MAKLIGYRRFTSKKNGETYCVATLLCDLTQRDIAGGCVGQKTEDIFVPSEQVNLLRPEDIGKQLQCNYEYSNGKAYLLSVAVK